MLITRIDMKRQKNVVGCLSIITNNNLDYGKLALVIRKLFGYYGLFIAVQKYLILR